MKRTEIKRYTPLTAKAPLERKTALNRSPFARSALHANSAAQRQQPRRTTASGPRVPAKVRAALEERSGGLCEIGQRGCTGYASEAAHRVKRGMGGRRGKALAAHDVLSNLLHGCHGCHSRCHSNPADAYAAGWMLREHDDPLTARVLYRGAWRWLADDGHVHDTNPHDAQEANTRA